MNKLSLVRAVLMTLGFFWTLVASAAPVVTGTTGALSHGSQLTISGTGFGTKNPAKPYLWAPFDGDANPSPLGIIQTWSEIQGMQYSPNEGFNGTGGLKGNPPSHPAAIWTAGINSTGFAWNDPGQQMYLFRRTKLNFAVIAEMNWKTLRVWPGPTVGGRDPNYYIATSHSSVATEGLNTAYGEGHGWPYGSQLSKLQDTKDKWQTEEILVKANTSNNVADGLFYHYLNGELVGQFPYTSWMTFRWQMRDGSQSGSGPMRQIYPIHGVLENYPINPNFIMWADDVYLDTTWARVLIGNAPTLAASSHREIQIPTAWSSNSITVSVNIRSFPSTGTPYLFVINSAGEVSNGIPLQQGGATLSSPTNLTVTPSQ